MDGKTSEAVRAVLAEGVRIAEADPEAGKRSPNGVCAKAVEGLGLPAEAGGETVRQIVITLVLEGGIPPNRTRSAELALPAWAAREPSGALADAIRRTSRRLEREYGGPARLQESEARALAREIEARWGLARAEAARAAGLDRGSGARQADVAEVLAVLRAAHADPAAERQWLNEPRSGLGGRTALELILSGTDEEVSGVRKAVEAAAAGG